MPKQRSVKNVVKSRSTIEGAGVHLKRAIGFGDPYEYDPFLLLDDFSSDDPDKYIKGFPWHPHRGIETITYILKGQVEHKDSIGNSGVIGPGDIQWMTAGSGIYHQEMPQGDENGILQGFQLWANLPSAYKMMKPRYRDVKQHQIPEIKKSNGILIKVIAGQCEDVTGPVKDVVTSPEYLDIYIPAGLSYRQEISPDKNAFVFVVDGSAVFCYEPESSGSGEQIGNGNVVLFGEGDYITITTGKSSVRVLLVSGVPISEQIAWHGPIVMNTEEELETAYEELDNGTFIKG